MPISGGEIRRGACARSRNSLRKPKSAGFCSRISAKCRRTTGCCALFAASLVAVGQVRRVALTRLVALVDAGDAGVFAVGRLKLVALADFAGEVAAAGIALARRRQLGQLVD